jgi:hypothetical protein
MRIGWNGMMRSTKHFQDRFGIPAEFSRLRKSLNISDRHRGAEVHILCAASWSQKMRI